MCRKFARRNSNKMYDGWEGVRERGGQCVCVCVRAVKRRRCRTMSVIVASIALCNKYTNSDLRRIDSQHSISISNEICER